MCFPFIKACVFGNETKAGLLDEVSNAPRAEGDSGSPVRQMVKLVFCAVGLQVSSLDHTPVACVLVPPRRGLRLAAGPVSWSYRSQASFRSAGASVAID